MLDLAVVIVTWNVRDLIEGALSSLYAELDDLACDVYVVDSASSDGTVEVVGERFPQVKLMACNENLGFVRANNLALRQIGFGSGSVDLPRAVFLLNPDTITRPGAVRTLYDALMAEYQIGLVGARLTYGDGSFQHSAFTFPGLWQLWGELFPMPGRLMEHPINGRYPQTLYAADEAFPVDFMLGATMMLKREVIQQVGLLDEAFFMYCEEIDWAWRIKKAGWRVYCVPRACVVHLSGQSTSQIKVQSLINLWTSRLKLFKKHYPAWKYQIAKRMIWVGMSWKINQISTDDPQYDSIIQAFNHIKQLAS